MNKLTPKQRAEVNDLMERAQDDLEGVLFELVYERDKAKEHAKSTAKAVAEYLIYK